MTGDLASPKPLRLGHTRARERLGMAFGSIGTSVLHSVRTAFRVFVPFESRTAFPLA